MTTILAADANAWADHLKINITTLDADLESQIVAEVFGAVSSRYSTNTWLNSATTPVVIKQIIAMKYVGWLFHRTYSTDTEPGVYGSLLLRDAQTLLDGVVSGYTVVVDPITAIALSESTAEGSIASELVDTDPKFSMDTVW